MSIDYNTLVNNSIGSLDEVDGLLHSMLNAIEMLEVERDVLQAEVTSLNLSLYSCRRIMRELGHQSDY